MVEYSQVELVRGIRNKDSAAYEYMIGKYTKTIYCLAYNIPRRRNFHSSSTPESINMSAYTSSKC